METPLLMASLPKKWAKIDMHFQGSTIICLQEAAEAFLVSLLEDCQPMCHTCKKGDNYAQGYSVGPLHPGRASKILKGPSKQANLLFVGCVGFFLFCLFLVPVQGREFKWVKHTKTARDFQFVNF